MLTVGDKILERGGKDVHIIQRVEEAEGYYEAIRIRDERMRKISFPNAIKTKRNPQLLIKSYGSEFEFNIVKVLTSNKVKHVVGREDRREDIVRFFVEESDYPSAKKVIDDYYKEDS